MAFDLDIQQAIYTRLNGSLSCPVYDEPRKDSAYPYAVIGDDASVDFDTDNTIGRDVIISIYVWDNYNGYQRIKQIVGEIDARLNRADFAVANHDLINCVFDSSDYFLEPDGKTRRAVISFRLLIDEA